MPVNKLQRFAEIEKMNHVFEYTDYQNEEREKPKSRWHSEIFRNKNPLVLELGCGKALATTTLAGLHPEKNFIGVDIKGARIWKGAKRAIRKGLNNVRFLRIYIEHLDEYFATDEVAEIWLTFPDPYPRAGDRDKRLTSPRFLKMYKLILKKKGLIHFKTDDDDLYNYTLQTVPSFGGAILSQICDLHEEGREDDAKLTIKTSFEKKHLANQKAIKYCMFVPG